MKDAFKFLWFDQKSCDQRASNNITRVTSGSMDLSSGPRATICVEGVQVSRNGRWVYICACTQRRGEYMHVIARLILYGMS